MSTLDSSSTLAEVEAAYDDNASYAEDGSTTKAKAFITACRIWLRRVAREAGKGGEQISLAHDQVQAELQRAQRWLADQPSTGGTGQTRYVGFPSDFRQ